MSCDDARRSGRHGATLPAPSHSNIASTKAPVSHVLAASSQNRDSSLRSGWNLRKKNWQVQRLRSARGRTRALRSSRRDGGLIELLLTVGDNGCDPHLLAFGGYQPAESSDRGAALGGIKSNRDLVPRLQLAPRPANPDESAGAG